MFATGSADFSLKCKRGRDFLVRSMLMDMQYLSMRENGVKGIVVWCVVGVILVRRGGWWYKKCQLVKKMLTVSREKAVMRSAA